MGVCIAGVAVAVALLFVVTGISLGLAAGATVESEDIDYWIVPDEGGAGSVPLEAEGARLSEVHDVTRRLREDDRIDYVSPVALRPLRLENPETGNRTYVIAVGVIPPDRPRRVADMDVSALDPEYAYYDDGTYDGEWSGEIVVSPGVAADLGLERGDTARAARSDRPLTVAAVNDREMAAGFGEVPAIAMPLAELQSMTGLAEADEADQILVGTTDPSVESALESVYPGTDVVSRTGIAGAEATPTNLPLAMALAAALVAGGIGIAFVATMMGLELTAGRRELAVLDAVGFSRRTRALVVVSETITVAVLGGIAGVVLGAIATVGTNAGIAAAIGVTALAETPPWLAAYAFGAAVVVGLCAAPYPLYLAANTDTLEELTR
ncbi:FtsX-like permease family protein [Halorubrum sp. CBA1125]|nr:FtsX-like permease family protein [Halorubrum sp. CBA1125]